MLWLLCCLCLWITAALCIAGVLSSAFKDSLLQRAGLAMLCVFCFGRAQFIWGVREVNVEWFGMHLGLAVFAIGTALKCYGAICIERRGRYIERRRSHDW